MRDTKKYAIPGYVRYQEVRRDTKKSEKASTRKYDEIRGTTGYGNARPYQEVRRARKYEIPRSTRYQDVRDIPGWATYQEVTGKIIAKFSLLGYFGIVIWTPCKAPEAADEVWL